MSDSDDDDEEFDESSKPEVIPITTNFEQKTKLIKSRSSMFDDEDLDSDDDEEEEDVDVKEEAMEDDEDDESMSKPYLVLNSPNSYESLYCSSYMHSVAFCSLVESMDTIDQLLSHLRVWEAVVSPPLQLDDDQIYGVMREKYHSLLENHLSILQYTFSTPLRICHIFMNQLSFAELGQSVINFAIRHLIVTLPPNQVSRHIKCDLITKECLNRLRNGPAYHPLWENMSKIPRVKFEQMDESVEHLILATLG
eukprot:CAMPEP_0117418754 /NCGR_PEP_ID=MMETSP0758-20121206/467_1 /TAXON_ID=63605 /ORGANISM="Percolomonas cosmopolitus, Strain AE-1 (ATCC 50343)" /LENGTH=251 /DNA_ID=CAMNT_0005199437 /DNA_START=355 /DNA_END=1106 /DNA_ORIENTATION=+